MSTIRFTTITDVINSIADAVDGSEYDLDAIARATHEYRVDNDAAGNELLNSAGFERTVTDDEFWAVVEDNEIAAK